ncbi:hypothetical protein AA313_de0202029 [Arthrobotrys entomopaga]|nr:hypothetical protein AA313_de0202029 [Arthrobotrys entomopaga]
MSFNPTINAQCSNMGGNGTVVCVSSPDGVYVPIAIPGSNSSWIGGEYADSAVPAPGPTPFGSTENCGQFYQVQVADTCSRISLAAQVSVPLFVLINPSIDEECDNLVPGLWYCTHPTNNWNATSTTGQNTTSTTLPAPGPTLPGTTDQCYRWHVVAEGDSCYVLETSFGITMDQLMAWNMDLEADCTNLDLGEPYCVQGPPLTTSTSTASSTTTSRTTTSTSTTSSTTKSTATTSTQTTSSTTSSIATTSTSTTSLTTSSTATTTESPTGPTAPIEPGTVENCNKWHTVSTGDGCWSIYTDAGLTADEFYAWNPEVGTDCSNLWLGYSVCIGVSD